MGIWWNLGVQSAPYTCAQAVHGTLRQWYFWYPPKVWWLILFDSCMFLLDICPTVALLRPLEKWRNPWYKSILATSTGTGAVIALNDLFSCVRVPLRTGAFPNMKHRETLLQSLGQTKESASNASSSSPLLRCVQTIGPMHHQCSRTPNTFTSGWQSNKLPPLYIFIYLFSILYSNII